MLDHVRDLEELSFRTLPALDHDRYDGWVLRWSDGGSRRGNSVNPVSPSTLPMADKITYCQEWFARRGASSIFRLTPLADASLSEELASRGYTPASPTDVMTCPIGDVSQTMQVGVADRPTDEWFTVAAGRPVGPSEALRLIRQMTSGDGTARFASVSETGGDVVAVGRSVDLDAFTTIYNMQTLQAAQRRGVATAILNALLALGKAGGCTHAVLQVTKDNAAAQSLYRGFGFLPTYEYSYMEPPAAG